MLSNCDDETQSFCMSFTTPSQISSINRQKCAMKAINKVENRSSRMIRPLVGIYTIFQRNGGGWGVSHLIKERFIKVVFAMK